MAKATPAGIGLTRRGLVTVVALLATACGSTSSSQPATQRSSPLPTPNYRYLNPAFFPAADTPIAQASASLRATWTAYDVTVIPSRHVLDNMPSPPKVINDTKGKLSDAEVQAMGWAEYRENAFIGWMEANLQPNFNNHLRVAGLFTGPIGNAVRAGDNVNNPACDLYASKMAVVPVDNAITNFESGKGFQVTSDYAIVELYPGGCSVIDGAGKPIYNALGSAVAIETGTITHDSVLGDIYIAESGRDCETTTQIPACGALGI